MVHRMRFLGFRRLEGILRLQLEVIDVDSEEIIQDCVRRTCTLREIIINFIVCEPISDTNGLEAV
jgi:hypothetical protein